MSTNFYHSIDDLLGDRRGRYFGDGYTKCSHAILEFTLWDRGDGIAFTCIGSVRVPPSWSIKGTAHQEPHLSTIDIVELSLACLRSVVRGTLNDHDVDASTVRNIRIVAGQAPVEGNLGSIPMRGHIREGETGAKTLDMHIANMDVTLEFVVNRRELRLASTSEKQDIAISDLMIDSERLAAAALVEPMQSSPVQVWPIAGCFATTLQLGQAMLYELDAIERAETNTLWMKRTTIAVISPVPCFEARQPIYVRLDNVRKYTKPDGHWRRAEVCGLVANTRIICSVTHRLPDRLHS
jgi:hypothetical protein